MMSVNPRKFNVSVIIVSAIIVLTMSAAHPASRWSKGGLSRASVHSSDYSSGHRSSLMRVADKQLISREEAAKRAQSRHGGRVISVQLVQSGKKGSPHYRVKLLSDGNLRVVNVNAAR